MRGYLGDPKSRKSRKSRKHYEILRKDSWEFKKSDWGSGLGPGLLAHPEAYQVFLIFHCVFLIFLKFLIFRPAGRGPHTVTGDTLRLALRPPDDLS